MMWTLSSPAKRQKFAAAQRRTACSCDAPALAAADIGLNTISLAGAGNGFTSGWQVRSATGATPATTATLQLKLMGLVQKTDNAFGAYAKHLVQINVHELGHGTGSAGV